MSVTRLHRHTSGFLAFSLLGSAALLTTPEEACAAEPAKEQARVDRYGDPLPPGVVMRLGTVRFRHGASGATFLPDSKTVVSTTQGNSIHFWDARSGRLLREINTGNLTVGIGIGPPLSVSRDRKRIAVIGALRDLNANTYHGVIAVFDAITGKELRVFEREPLDQVYAVALTSDGQFLMSIGRKGALRIEEIQTGTEFLRHQFPGDVLAGMALSPDDSTLALGSGPNTRKLFLWKWQSGNAPRELKVPDRTGRYLAFSPDSKLLAESSDIGPLVRVWDVESGRNLRNLELLDEDPYWNYSLAFSPNGKNLAVAASRNREHEIHLWDPNTGKLRGHLPLGSGHISFSPDGQLLVVGRRVWDFAARREISANGEAPFGQVQHILTADKDLVVTVSAFGEDSIRFWDAATGKQRMALSQNGWIPDISLSSDGKHLVSTSLDDSVCLWDVTTGRKIFRLAGHGKTGGRRAVAFTPDRKHFLSWGDDMYLRKWDTTTGKAVFEHAIRPTGMRVFTEDDDSYERDMFFNINNGRFSPDAKLFILAASRKYFVFDAATGKELRVLAAEGSHQMALAASPDSTLLLTSAYGKPVETKLPGGGVQHSTADEHLVCLWDLSSGKLVRQITVPVQQAGAVAFSPDGKLIAEAAGYTASSVRIWEAASGREVAKLEGIRGGVRSLAFMPDGKRLVTGMEDSTALIWDLAKIP